MISLSLYRCTYFSSLRRLFRFSPLSPTHHHSILLNPTSPLPFHHTQVRPVKHNGNHNDNPYHPPSMPILPIQAYGASAEYSASVAKPQVRCCERVLSCVTHALFSEENMMSHP